MAVLNCLGFIKGLLTNCSLFLGGIRDSKMPLPSRKERHSHRIAASKERALTECLLCADSKHCRHLEVRTQDIQGGSEDRTFSPGPMTPSATYSFIWALAQDRSGFKSQFHHLPVVWPWAFKCLHLSFYSSEKMWIITVPVSYSGTRTVRSNGITCERAEFRAWHLVHVGIRGLLLLFQQDLTVRPLMCWHVDWK